MKIRDRIKELRRVRAGELRPHPRNWRTHPAGQREALRGVLAEIGYAAALLARELADGSLELIDGHLRAETTPEELVPVLVLDVTAEEAARLLATHDPLVGLAGRDQGQLDGLLAEVRFENPAVNEMLEALRNGPAAGDAVEEGELPENYLVVVECQDEDQQREVWQKLTEEGHKCRLTMM